MSQIEKYHNKAMVYTEMAEVGKFKGGCPKRVQKLLQMAFFNEKKAALLARKNAQEPTLSVLHLSAANLATDCGYYDLAEELANYALLGVTVPKIRSDLQDILRLVKFHRIWCEQ